MNPSRTAGAVLHTDRSIPTGRSACGSYLTTVTFVRGHQSPANLHDSSTKLRARQEAFPVPLRCMITARQSTEQSRQRSASARVPRLVGGLVGVTGFITLLTALDVGPDRPLSRLFLAVPLSLRAVAASVEALAGLGQMLVAGGLVRRQRRAWVAAIGLLTTAAAGHMVGEIRPFSFGVVVVALALLVATSSEFSVRPAP